MKKLNRLLGSLALAFAACQSIPMDRSVSAAEGRDVTVTLEGCQEGPKNGYLFCRSQEGSGSGSLLTLTVPPLSCSDDRTSCAQFQFFRKDGSTGYGGGIPKGQNHANFTVGQVIGTSDDIQEFHDGEYRVEVIAFFQDNDGMEHSRTGSGLVRVKVLRRDYVPALCDAPEIAWKVDLKKDCQAHITTQYRSAICGKGCR